MTTPEPFSMPIAEPVWLVCECGAKTSAVPCWDCDRASKAKQDAIVGWRQTLASIPHRFVEADGKDPVWRSRVKVSNLDTAIESIVASRTATIFGPSGSGKTVLGVMSMKARGVEGMFVDAGDLENARFAQAFGKGAELIERAESIPLLLIDEVDGRRAHVGAVWSVIKHRHDYGLLTYVTTGHEWEQIKSFYGDGALRRLFEPSSSTLVMCGKP